MKEINRADQIPRFKNEIEEARFWTTHSLGDGLLKKMHTAEEKVYHSYALVVPSKGSMVLHGTGATVTSKDGIVLHRRGRYYLAPSKDGIVPRRRGSRYRSVRRAL